MLFTVDWGMLLRVDNGGERRSDDNPLHSRGVGLDRLQDSSRTLDGGVQEVLDGVLDIEVKRRCCVEDIVEWRVGFNSLLIWVSHENGIYWGDTWIYTSSNAPSSATSLTMTYDSFSLGRLGWFSRIF